MCCCIYTISFVLDMYMYGIVGVIFCTPPPLETRADDITEITLLYRVKRWEDEASFQGMLDRISQAITLIPPSTTSTISQLFKSTTLAQSSIPKFHLRFRSSYGCMATTHSATPLCRRQKQKRRSLTPAFFASLAVSMHRS
ncbi:hypothetical protein GQ43DRAFT_129925 [Delitschia confertaspora ATCC 74209]|uniref:Uncharacterized protein n=1 Tax=Delitschia confertaspora ATCC 74209 TaxID=1513339 RepID=A0A9P4JGQ4_9PLEO|nr:hypothetical protein GQ43DRAFT_129925 [Delitschia confertaspora ATCC 74209]